MVGSGCSRINIHAVSSSSFSSSLESASLSPSLPLNGSSGLTTEFTKALLMTVRVCTTTKRKGRGKIARLAVRLTGRCGDGTDWLLDDAAWAVGELAYTNG